MRKFKVYFPEHGIDKLFDDYEVAMNWIEDHIPSEYWERGLGVGIRMYLTDTNGFIKIEITNNNVEDIVCADAIEKGGIFWHFVKVSRKWEDQKYN